MTITSACILAGIHENELDHVLRALQKPRSRRGRPWSGSLRERILITGIALRTNLTIRELGALFEIPKSAIHRIVAMITPRLANLFKSDLDRRYSWIVDGTLIPTRDHAVAAKSKNYRWSCNAQVLVRRLDLRVIAVHGGGAGNRNDPIPKPLEMLVPAYVTRVQVLDGTRMHAPFAGANVALRSRVTDEVMASSVTGTDGDATLSVPSGGKPVEAVLEVTAASPYAPSYLHIDGGLTAASSTIAIYQPVAHDHIAKLAGRTFGLFVARRAGLHWRHSSPRMVPRNDDSAMR